MRKGLLLVGLGILVGTGIGWTVALATKATTIDSIQIYPSDRTIAVAYSKIITIPYDTGDEQGVTTKGEQKFVTWDFTDFPTVDFDKLIKALNNKVLAVDGN